MKDNEAYIDTGLRVDNVIKGAKQVINAVTEMTKRIADKAQSCKGLIGLIYQSLYMTANAFYIVGAKAASSLGKIAKSILSPVENIKRLARLIRGTLVGAFNIAKKTITGFGKKFKETNGNGLRMGFKNILKYGLGVRSVFALVNKLRRALVDGFKNLAQFNNGMNPVNDSLSNLKSSFLQLKNSFATAFAPLLTAIEPVITRITDLISGLVTKMGELFASLSGATAFTKAIKTQENYAKSLKKTSNYLSGLDEIKTYDSGKEAGTSSPEQMFETVAIDSKIAELASRIMEVISPVKDFFSHLFDNVDVSVLETSFGRIKEIIAPIKDFFKPLMSDIGKSIKKVIEDVVTWVDEFTKMLEGKSGKIQKIVGFVVTAVRVAIQFIVGMLKPFLTMITNIIDHVIDILDGLIDFIVGVFAGDWELAWKGIRNVFIGIWNVIVDIFEGILNMIIGGLNNISVDIPDVIPVIGGKHVGFNIPEVKFNRIPALANGTVVPRQSKEFMAILGDNNKESEVVSPLSTIEQALENVLSRQSIGGGSYQFTAQINRRTIFNEIIEEAKMRQMQSNTNPFMAL